MKRTVKNSLVKKALEKELRVTATFTLDGEVYAKFKAECEKSKVAMSRVLEAFMADFIKGEK